MPPKESSASVQLFAAGFCVATMVLLVWFVFPYLITPDTLFNCARFHFALALITLIGTSFKKAPYGKHSDEALPDPQLSARVGWIVQEFPTLFAVLYTVHQQYLADERKTEVQLMYETNLLQDLTGFIHPLLSVVAASCRLFCIHYIHRTLIFPFQFSPSAPAALRIVFAATVYCSFNGLLQATATQAAPGIMRPLSLMELSPAQFPIAIVGLLIFGFGMYVNIKADYALIALRTKSKSKSESPSGKHIPQVGALKKKASTPALKGKTESSTTEVEEDRNSTASKASRYKIPTGFWLYDYISCPNFFGEIVEWCGYAIFVTAFAVSDHEAKLTTFDILVSPWLALVGLAAPNEVAPSSMAAWSFAVYTLSNVGPRAIAHHRWYLETFGDRYATLKRKAFIPFIL